MHYARLFRMPLCLIALQVLLVATAVAEWKAASDQVVAAAKNPDIAAVLEAVNQIDNSLIVDDKAAFAGLLAPDLVVNNPQNGISIPGAMARRDAAGMISYSKYVRSVEYAGKLGDMVLLMGDERVVPKGSTPMAGNRGSPAFYRHLEECLGPLGLGSPASHDHWTLGAAHLCPAHALRYS